MSCLLILSKKYHEIDRKKPLHITSFQWNTILEIAEAINEIIPCNVIPSSEVDTVQLDKRNEPDPYILTFWTPRASNVPKHFDA